MSEVRIVVVDDNQDAAATIAELLRMNGYVVQTCFDGEEALVLVRNFEPHAVVLDCMMPGLSGFELATRLRQSHGDDVVLIAVTGLDEKAFGVGQTFQVVDHHLNKPIDFAKLTKVLPKVG